ncbi:MAG: GTPase [Lachnospiraceae bacterium]|nr:GTPase [Lachnospiraceae bacterium]
MGLRNKIPVYVINGFLESGKTAFIKETITDPYFSDGGTTLLIACEEGEEEYDEKELKKSRNALVQVEDKEDFNPAFLKGCQRNYNPTQVVIEYNGMWGMDLLREMELPAGWFLAQIITLADAGTFDLYMQNMKSLFMDMAKEADLIIFNRCVDETTADAYKRNMRAMNPGAQVEFERENGEPFEFEETLPYDLDAQIIDIDDIDFGIWYVDAMDYPEHYEGKTVRFKGQVYKNHNLGREHFVPGRKVMTCCADDVAFLGYLCHTNNLDKLRRGQWLTVTALVRYEERREYSGKRGPVLYTKALKSAEAPQVEMVAF